MHKTSKISMFLHKGFIVALCLVLVGCSFNVFNDPPANIQVRLVSYNETLPKSFFEQSMAVIRVQYPRADFRSTVPSIPYGNLEYAYIEYRPEKGSEEIYLHALITDHRYAWRIDERFKVKDRLKYRTKFNTILENIHRARDPEYLRADTPE